MATEIKIEGLPELSRALGGLSGDLRDLSALNAKVGDDLAAEIGRLAPRDTGRLADSWRGSADASKAEASSDLNYAGCQEYGVPSHNIEGKHYAERGLDAAGPAIESTYDEGVQKLCTKAET